MLLAAEFLAILARHAANHAIRDVPLREGQSASVIIPDDATLEERLGRGLDGRYRTIVIAESLAGVIAAIRITFVGGHISLQNAETSAHRPWARCVARASSALGQDS